MKKLLSSLISLIIFIAVGATGVGFYGNIKSSEMADQTIEMFKANGFDLSSYDDLDIDYFNQSVSLKNLKIASSQQAELKFVVGEIRLEGINPIKDLSIFVKNTQFKNIELTYFGQNYKIDNVVANGLKLDYQPHFERIFAADNLTDRISFFHQEVGYDRVSFAGFYLTDEQNNTSRIADGSYSKQQLVGGLPSQWNVNLTGLEISPAHLPPQYAQLLADYKLKELNGILDVSFAYQQDERTALFAINNLNFGGLANLQSDILTSMTDERFVGFYDLSQLDQNINSLPIEHAEFTYDDAGLYNYFIAQQAPKMQLTEAGLKTQVYFGLVLGSSQITNVDRRQALANPIGDFLNEPAGLRIELSPAKPVRFQQYLNVYDADILVRDLNPSVTYIK